MTEITQRYRAISSKLFLTFISHGVHGAHGERNRTLKNQAGGNLASLHCSLLTANCSLPLALPPFGFAASGISAALRLAYLFASFITASRLELITTPGILTGAPTCATKPPCTSPVLYVVKPIRYKPTTRAFVGLLVSLVTRITELYLLPDGCACNSLESSLEPKENHLAVFPFMIASGLVTPSALSSVIQVSK